MVATPEFLPYKHFRLALYPVTINGRTKSSSSHRVLEIGTTVANAQLVRSERTWIESIITSQLSTSSDQGESQFSSGSFLLRDASTV